MTVKSFPRNFSIVLAFAGDSTITRFFILFYFQVRQGRSVTIGANLTLFLLNKQCNFALQPNFINFVVKFRLIMTEDLEYEGIEQQQSYGAENIQVL